jgi:pimeloyl-ACP methyl ester carboxylesterase
VDHDLRDTAEQIDTSQLPVYVLTGEYDWSSTPEMGAEVARRVKGARYRMMEGLGHFPMSEHPERFLEFISPVLDEIAGLTA